MNTIKEAKLKYIETSIRAYKKELMRDLKDLTGNDNLSFIDIQIGVTIGTETHKTSLFTYMDKIKAALFDGKL